MCSKSMIFRQFVCVAGPVAGPAKFHAGISAKTRNKIFLICICLLPVISLKFDLAACALCLSDQTSQNYVQSVYYLKTVITTERDPSEI